MLDAIVIGAGPAGSLTALLLARAGWRITIVEQHRFPRGKVCGECLSALGIDVLKRHGLWENLSSLGAVRLTTAALHDRRGNDVRLPLPRLMAGISRTVLDTFLLDEARSAGAVVLQPYRCESIEFGPTPKLRVRNLCQNRVETLMPSHMIVADGKASRDRRGGQLSGGLGISAHFTQIDAPRDAIELFSFDGAYGGLAPIEAERWNAAFSVPVGRVRRHRGNLSSLLEEFISENRTLANRLHSARMAGPILASPLPRHPVSDNWPSNVVCVGNSAAALEPIGGEGMGLALLSAEIAAGALLKSCSSGRTIDVQKIQRQYRLAWNPRRIACRAAGGLASSQLGSTIGIRLIASHSSLCRPVMGWMGKS